MLFPHLSLLKVCVSCRQTSAINYDVLLSNNKMLYTVTGAAQLAESMLNSQAFRTASTEGFTWALTHSFSLVPLQSSVHELYGHLLVLSQPGQDKLKEPAGKQTHEQKPAFILILPSVVVHLTCVTFFSLILTAELKKKKARSYTGYSGTVSLKVGSSLTYSL